MAVRIILVLGVCAACGCGGSEPTAQLRLADAVAELGEVGKPDDFVVIEAPDSDRFVEVRVGEEGKLQAEFPIRTVTVSGAGRNLKFVSANAAPEIKGREVVHLDEEELPRLLDVVQRNGLDPKYLNLVAVDGDGKPVGWIHSLVVVLDRREPERVSEFAFDVFRDVHGVDAVEGYVISRRIKG